MDWCYSVANERVRDMTGPRPRDLLRKRASASTTGEARVPAPMPTQVMAPCWSLSVRPVLYVNRSQPRATLRSDRAGTYGGRGTGTGATGEGRNWQRVPVMDNHLDDYRRSRSLRDANLLYPKPVIPAVLRAGPY